MPRNTLAVILAFTAFTLAVINDKVVTTQRMTLWTMCLGSIDGNERSRSTQEINPTSSRLKMSGIHTCAIATEMIEVETFWNLPNQLFIKNTMSKMRIAIEGCAPIPILIPIP